MIAPERDRQGLDEALIRAWDRNSGAVLAFGPSEQPRGVIDRLHWPQSHLVPSFVKPLTRRAVRVPNLPTPFNRLISAMIYPVVQVVCADAAAARGVRADSPLRQRVHRAVGTSRAQVRPRCPARRLLSELAIHRAAARPLLHRRAQATRRSATATRSIAIATNRSAASRCSWISSRIQTMSRAQDAAALGRSRSTRGGLGQGPLLADERRVPARPAAERLLQREVHARSEREGQRRAGPAEVSTTTPRAGTSRSGDSEQDR